MNCNLSRQQPQVMVKVDAIMATVSGSAVGFDGRSWLMFGGRILQEARDLELDDQILFSRRCDQPVEAPA